MSTDYQIIIYHIKSEWKQISTDFTRWFAGQNYGESAVRFFFSYKYDHAYHGITKRRDKTYPIHCTARVILILPPPRVNWLGSY